MQEARNAVDQASREVTNRFDFKGTDSTVELTGTAIALNSSAEDRVRALMQVVEEKLVKRKVSLKGLSWGTIEDAAGGRSKVVGELSAGISSEKAKELNKFIKALGIKGVSSSSQGESIRVQSKKRDHLQTVMSEMREADFEIPIQFGNFRD